ncbi:MAG: hypothetical protein PCFJNLEI_00818 [Verrucomicrobiae bacterium]|nr:hypothetical protein [Verrucomicrobiae bacterium]
MNGTMTEFPLVDLCAGGLADDLITVVHYVKDFVRTLHGVGVAGCWGKEKPPDCSGGFSD